jgi:hypothetical protein
MESGERHLRRGRRQLPRAVAGGAQAELVEMPRSSSNVRISASSSAGDRGATSEGDDIGLFHHNLVRFPVKPLRTSDPECLPIGHRQGVSNYRRRGWARISKTVPSSRDGPSEPPREFMNTNSRLAFSGPHAGLPGSAALRQAQERPRPGMTMILYSSVS